MIHWPVRVVGKWKVEMSTIASLRTPGRTGISIKALVTCLIFVAVLQCWQTRFVQAEDPSKSDWLRLARTASTERSQNEAALFWLKTASVQASPEAILQLRRVWSGSGSLPSTIATFAHGDRVRYASFSPDGQRAVTACDDYFVRVWDVATGQQLGKPLKHEKDVEYAAFTPDNKRIVTVERSGTARVWDSVSGELIFTPKMWEFGGEIHVEFSRDGSRVTANGQDKKVRVWDSLTGKQVGKTLEGDESLFHPIFSRDGQRIVTVSPDRTASVWDVMTGKELGQPMTHDGTFQYPGFSADGQRLYTHFRPRGEILIWNVTSGQQVGRPLPHAHNVIGVEFNPMGGGLPQLVWMVQLVSGMSRLEN